MLPGKHDTMAVTMATAVAIFRIMIAMNAFVVSPLLEVMWNWPDISE